MKGTLQKPINGSDHTAIKCICADRDKISRQDTERMLRKIEWLHLIKTYASLDTALAACRKQKVDLLFVRLYIFPVPPKLIRRLRQIMKLGVKIVVLTNQIRIVKSVLTSEFVNYVHLPTTSRGLCKASMKALQIKEFAAGEIHDSRFTIHH